jgi:hypothetical protein
MEPYYIVFSIEVLSSFPSKCLNYGKPVQEAADCLHDRHKTNTHIHTYSALYYQLFNDGLQTKANDLLNDNIISRNFTVGDTVLSLKIFLGLNE